MIKHLFCVFIFLFSFLQASETKILVLFNSVNGGTYRLAQAVAQGIEQVPETKAILKRVPHFTEKKKDKKIWDEVPIADIKELANYDGIAFGSPVYFGNMSAEMRHFLDQTIPLWMDNQLLGKPASVFMSAGSGDANQVAILSFWNTLATHGMLLVSMGKSALQETTDKNNPQGLTSFGTTALMGLGSDRPSELELKSAVLQGKALANTAKALQNYQPNNTVSTTKTEVPKENNTIKDRLKQNNIVLPNLPEPVGNYQLFSRTGNLVFINQVALKEGKILHPGTLNKEVTTEQVREATRQTLLNVLAVLDQAVGLENVQKAVQITGFFNTLNGFQDHAQLLNEASDLLIAVFGEQGKHARAAVGASSLPLNSAVEIQAVFEVK